MNSVDLTGRLTRDPEIRYTSGDNMAVATFNLAVDRDGQKDNNGNKVADFPRVTAFGKTAELIEKYIKKGSYIEVQGRIQTGSYKNKNGDTIYTTDVVANRIGFGPRVEQSAPRREPTQETFEEVNEDVPF
ncbi:MAG: single-stranded DNA-binding protein [Mogibacterium sp.]|nr:single-stranded DNA-binding protein [Mogibacterium sp.]